MTTFTPGTSSGFPSDCTELSKAVIWAFVEAERLQPKAQITLTQGEPAQFMVSKSVSKTPQHGTRFTGAAYLFLEENWASTTGKMWEKLRTGSFLTADGSPPGAIEDFAPGTGGSCPSTVNTIPKLIYWISDCFKQCNSSEAIIETEFSEATGQGGAYLPVGITAQFETFYYGPLAFCRVSVPIDPLYASTSQLLYKGGLAQSGVILPSTLTTA